MVALSDVQRLHIFHSHASCQGVDAIVSGRVGEKITEAGSLGVIDNAGNSLRKLLSHMPVT
jgi:hypothetical protein